jgi:hypothetical protein
MPRAAPSSKADGPRRSGRGGVWRIPPALDGSQRNPLPRFTVLTGAEQDELEAFFARFAERALSVLVPGGHLFIASHPDISASASSSTHATSSLHARAFRSSRR